MGIVADFRDGLVRFNKAAFDPRTGLRESVFTVAPVVVGLAVNQPDLLFAGTGAMFLTRADGQPSTLPVRVLFGASLMQALAFGLGRLVSTTAFSVSVALLSVGVFLALLLRASPRWTQVGTYVAMTFAVGVGLPGGSMRTAEIETPFLLLGGMSAVLGAWLQRGVAARGHPEWRPKPAVQSNQTAQGAGSQPSPVETALVVAVAATLGYVAATGLDLPRDYWVVVTVIVSVRPSLGTTVSLTGTRAVGTVVGAVIAAAVVLGTNSPYLLAPLVFAFAFLMFSTRGVNNALMQVFMVPFLIIMFNMIFPGQWYLAIDRVVDTLIGGAIAVVVISLLEAMRGHRGNPAAASKGE